MKPSRLADNLGGIALPSHAYVPGRTARHAENAFDAITASVVPGMEPAELVRTKAWRAGLHYLQAGYYWECHEVLEPVWMQLEEGTPERDMVQALIQLANARLKLRMGRPRATLRLCAMVEAHLARCGRDGAVMGLFPAEVVDWIQQVRREAQGAS